MHQGHIISNIFCPQVAGLQELASALSLNATPWWRLQTTKLSPGLANVVIRTNDPHNEKCCLFTFGHSFLINRVSCNIASWKWIIRTMISVTQCSHSLSVFCPQCVLYTQTVHNIPIMHYIGLYKSYFPIKVMEVQRNSVLVQSHVELLFFNKSSLCHDL